MHIKSWKSMFNKATFWEIFLLSPGRVNTYVAYVYRKYKNLDRSNRTWGPGRGKLLNATN